MGLWALIAKEIRYRKSAFVLMILMLALAFAAISGTLAFLRLNSQNNERLENASQAEMKTRMAELEEDFKRITKNMGFNLLIVPEGQDLSQLYNENFASKTMPEEYSIRLSKAQVVTINHVLPSLMQMVKWKEQKRSILLIGVRGEVYIQSERQSMIQEAVPKGEIVLGYELHHSLKLNPGDRVQLMGKDFTVKKCYPQRGNKDDISAWIDLSLAQEMLAKPGQINSILALECGCSPSVLAHIREEVESILPGTRVVEFATKALARAEARNQATQTVKVALETELKKRESLQSERERFSANLMPIILILGVASVAFFTLQNARSRYSELGILNALGFKSSRILSLLLGRAVLAALLGSVLGLVGVLLFIYLWSHSQGLSFLPAINLKELFICFIAAPILAALSAWLPAQSAAQRDAAEVLREN